MKRQVLVLAAAFLAACSPTPEPAASAGPTGSGQKGGDDFDLAGMSLTIDGVPVPLANRGYRTITEEMQLGVGLGRWLTDPPTLPEQNVPTLTIIASKPVAAADFVQADATVLTVALNRIKGGVAANYSADKANGTLTLTSTGGMLDLAFKGPMKRISPEAAGYGPTIQVDLVAKGIPTKK